MLQCLSFKSASTATSPTINLQNVPTLSPAGTSMEGTPRSSAQQSPGFNLNREYTHALERNSYVEMWSRVHVFNEEDHQAGQIEVHVNDDDDNEDRRQQLLTHVLDLNRECVEETLNQARDNHLTRLASEYFSHSENTTYLCHRLHRCVHRAQALYDPLHKLLSVLQLDSDPLTESQCDRAYEIFQQFDCFDNPFPFPDSHYFDEMRSCYSLLRRQLDHKLNKSRSRVSLVRRATAGSVLCVIGVTLTVALSAAAIASHALVAIVACPVCAMAYHPRNITKKELAHVKQLDDAARGAYVLNSHLDSIHCLVSRLHSAVEDDKHLIKLSLLRDRDRHFILEALKHLDKNRLSFIDQLSDLEVHICLCYNVVNKARSLLHDEIHLYQSSRR